MQTDYDDLVDALMADDDGEDFNVDEPPPSLADADHVDVYLARIVRFNAQADALGEAFDRRIEQLEARRDDLLSGIGKAREWHERALLGFAASHFAGLDPKIRTVNLPHGALIRTKPGAPRVADVTDDIARSIHELLPDVAPQPAPKIAKAVAKALCTPGKALGTADAEGYVPHQAQAMLPNADGEPVLTDVPGLVLLVRKTDRITYKAGA